jgi:hypothetical protein
MRNNTQVAHGSLTLSSIQISVDGLAPGLYEYTLYLIISYTIYLEHGGHADAVIGTYDTVIVRVLPRGNSTSITVTTTSFTGDALSLILMEWIIILGSLSIIVVVVIRWKIENIVRAHSSRG